MKLLSLLIIVFFSLFSNLQAQNRNVEHYKKIALKDYSIQEISKLIVFYKDSLSLVKESENYQNRGFYSLVISNLYYNIGNYNKAIYFDKKALECFKTTKDTIFIMNALLSLSAYYGEINEQKTSLNFLKDLEKYAKESKNKAFLFNTYINMSMAYATINYNKAITYIKKAENLKNESTDNIFFLNNAKAGIYYVNKNYTKALKYYLKSARSIDPTSKYYSAINANIAEVYMKLNKIDSAEFYSLKILNNSDSLAQTSIDYSNTFSILTEVYLNKQNNKDALLYFRKYKDYINSVMVNKKNEFISKLNVIYQTDSLVQANKQKTIEIKQYKTRFIWSVILAVMVMIVAVVIFFLYKKLNKSYRNIIKESVKYIKVKEENKALKNQIESLTNGPTKKTITIDDIENSDLIFEKIIDVIETQKLYTDKDFNIAKLSEIIGVNRSYISKIINAKTNLSFIKFVNSYRVEEAKQLLLDNKNKNLTLSAIGELAGFKSETSFYRVFKSELGMTPSYFISHST